MERFNQTLYQLQQQIERAAQLRAEISRLKEQQKLLNSRVKALGNTMKKEQRDVERLSGWSVVALYHHISGTLVKQMDTERHEADTAQAEYDAAVSELSALEENLGAYEAELALLDGCEARYQALLKEKLEHLKFSGGETAENIASMEKRIAKLEAQKKEIRQTIITGNSALYIADRVTGYLEGAKGWSIGDIVSKGALAGLFDHSKRNELESAKECVEELKSAIKLFQSKLAALSVTTTIRCDISEFKYFNNYFFIGADLAFHTKLKSAQKELSDAVTVIRRTISRLEDLAVKLGKDRERTQAKLDKLVLKAK